MALPTSTTNLDTATINGIVYTYNSTKGAWYKQSTASTNVPVTISGTLSVSGNANVGNLGSPTVVNGNSNVTVTANSDVSIAANGAVRVTVAASGNVGVGTASPIGKLAVVGGYTQLSGGTTAQAGLRVQYASSVATVTGINHDNDAFNPISFYTGVTEAMRIDASGNLGIANTAPTHKLSVTGTVNVSGNANVGNLGTAAVVATANVSTTAKYVKTTGASITGGAAANITRYPTFTATSNADIHLSSTITGNATVSQNYGITFAQGSYGTTGAIMFSENNSDGTAIGFYVSNNYSGASQLKVSIEPSGTILPGSNVAQNLGSTTLRWSTVYTGDLELSNGIGDYTIVEGEDDLFLYNNRSGKTYRFMLQEVDPAIVPPKKGT